MFFFRLKMSVAVDTVSMIAMAIAIKVLASYGASVTEMAIPVFVALAIELTLSIARAFDLKATTFLWCVQKKEVDNLQKEVNRLRSDNNKG